MNFDFRRQAIIHAAMGALCMGITGYMTYKTVLAWTLYDNVVDNSTFALAAFSFLLGTLFVLYIGAAYAFGELRSVSGNRDSAMLIGRSGVVAYPVRIRFSRIIHPDHEDANLPPTQRHALFIVGWRPWVCPESTFLQDAGADADPAGSNDRTGGAPGPVSRP